MPIFKVTCCLLYLESKIQFETPALFAVLWTDLHLTSMESRDPPPGLGFYFASILVLLICKLSFFQWLKEKWRQKTSLKGRWRLKLQLLWLFWLEMSECWSKGRDALAAFWLHLFCQLFVNWVLKCCWLLIFHLKWNGWTKALGVPITPGQLCLSWKRYFLTEIKMRRNAEYLPSWDSAVHVAFSNHQ